MAEAKKTKDSKDSKDTKDDNSKRVLIVDDDAELGKMLEKFLISAGIEAKSITKGKDALEIFKDFRPRLVLLDLLLPDMMGFDVLKKMKERPWAEKVSFVIISGILKSEKEKAKARDEGAIEFLEKPFDVRKLHNTILKVLGMSSVEELEGTPKPSTEKIKNISTGKAPTFPEPQVTIEGGDLAQADLPRLMAAFFTAKVSGVLTVSSGDIIKAIYFEDGRPIFAASKDPRDRLGEITLRMRKATKEQLDDALKFSKNEMRLGGALVHLGILAPSELYEIIQTQIREIIYSTYAWSSGRYAFKFENLAGREMIKLQTPPADIVLEGIRRYYTAPRLKNLLLSMDRLFIKSPNPLFRDQELHLGGSELRILEMLNGSRSIRQVIADSKVAEELVMQVLYGLLVMQVIVDKSK